jgi:ABC-type Fe3+-hydroxamate transport system substrate-binding protein
MMRTKNAESIMDMEWQNLKDNKSCFTQKRCFHKNPTTVVSSAYNNAEILAYNGLLPAPTCDIDWQDYRLTNTRGSTKEIVGNKSRQHNRDYPDSRCPVRYYKTNRVVPDGLRNN